MSEYTTRPHVRTVTASPQNTGSGSGAAVAAGAILAGAAVVALLRATGQAWASTRSMEASAPTPRSFGVVESPAALRDQFSTEERQAAAALLANHHTPADALKMATLHALERIPFRAHALNLDAPVAALARAQDVAEVERARSWLLQAMERDHLGVFVQHLSEAAAAASREAGFETVEVRHGADGTSARIIATDAAGRSLVSEIAPDTTGEVNLATEAVGIMDGSCHTALDDFDAALEHLGVRSGRPARTTTGGVCETAFAREFLRTRARIAPRPAAVHSSAGSTELSRRRAQNHRSDTTRTKS